MIIIRFQRIGRKNKPSFKLALMEKTRKVKGKFIEKLGWYDPFTKKAGFNIERIKYWLSKGAQLSDTVYNLLINKKIISGKKINVVKIKKTETKEAIKPEGAEAQK